MQCLMVLGIIVDESIRVDIQISTYQLLEHVKYRSRSLV